VESQMAEVLTKNRNPPEKKTTFIWPEKVREGLDH